MFQPYGGYPPTPQYIFVPTPGGAQQPNASPFDINGITAAIQGLEMLKKQFKEEKKDEKKKPEMPSVFGVVVLLLLLSPLTGPVVFSFFQWGARLIH